MADFKKISMGMGSFVIAYFACFISYYVVTAILDEFLSGNLLNFFYFGLFIIFLFLMVILPAYLHFQGITQTSDMDPFKSTIIGISILVLGLLALYLLQSEAGTFTAAATLLPDDYLKGLYWVGLILNIILLPIIVFPITLFLKNRTD